MPHKNTQSFQGQGDPTKCFDIRKRVPQWMNTKVDTTFRAVLCATGTLNDTLAGRDVTTQTEQVVQALLLRTATGEDLSVIGQNFGVTRPDFALFDDELYRKLIPILATKRKSALKIFFEVI